MSDVVYSGSIGDDFWVDLTAAAEDPGMDYADFIEYLDRRANERAIELLGEFAEVEYG